jgi:fatty acid desaturase
MATHTDPRAPGQPERSGLAAGTRVVTQALGTDSIRSLHKENRAIDVLVGVCLLLLTTVNAAALGELAVGPIWVGLLVLQGFLFQILAFYAHDVFVHRNAGSARARAVLGPLFMTPATQVYSEYRHAHLSHHRYVNTASDSEEYKRDFDRRWVKVSLLTLAGTQLSWFGGFRRGDRTPWKPDYSEPEARRVKMETYVVVLWLAVAVGLALLAPGPIIRGYFLPLVLVAPVASSLRVILEHADSDPGDPLKNSTFYRTGWVSGPAFFWDSGDCHLVHHLFPAIPFYRMRRAVRLIRPVLIDAGVQEHRSFLSLLKSWFIDNKAHGTPWREPASSAG